MEGRLKFILMLKCLSFFNEDLKFGLSKIPFQKYIKREKIELFNDREQSKTNELKIDTHGCKLINY